MNLLRIGAAILLSVLLGAAGSPVQPYAIIGGKSVVVGDGSASSAPMPVTVTTPGGSTDYTPLGCFQITSLTTAQSLPTVPTGATLISLSVENQSVRMTDFGSAPTATVGLLFPVGGPWPYSGSLANVKFIQTGSGAVIDYCAYK